MHLVTCGHFRSRNKNSGHVIWSAIAENLTLNAHFMALCFVEPELLPIKVLHCRNNDFLHFCSCDLVLDPMIFIYELDPYSLEIYHTSANELPMSRLSISYLITYTCHWNNYIPHHFAGGQQQKCQKQINVQWTTNKHNWQWKNERTWCTSNLKNSHSNHQLRTMVVMTLNRYC